jgi:hypothetical protein
MRQGKNENNKNPSEYPIIDSPTPLHTKKNCNQSQSCVDPLEEVNFLRFDMDVKARSSEMCGRVVWQIGSKILQKLVAFKTLVHIHMYRECLKFVDRFTALRFTATDESPAARRI